MTRAHAEATDTPTLPSPWPPDGPRPAASFTSPMVTGATPNSRNASTTRCRASVNWFGTAPANR